ncbi:hypothetical protein [Acetoanaerobium sticklandii]|uniref:hypothetical protein n=1 Tax=Acetoanaerobium sticklandii TaxID=1511 RepID=UPI003A9332A0
MSVNNEVIKICNDYFETYLKERNFEKLLQFLNQDFKGIGTGEDEFSKDSYNSMRLFKRDIEQAPSESPVQVSRVRSRCSKHFISHRVLYLRL